MSQVVTSRKRKRPKRVAHTTTSAKKTGTNGRRRCVMCKRWRKPQQLLKVEATGTVVCKNLSSCARHVR